MLSKAHGWKLHRAARLLHQAPGAMRLGAGTRVCVVPCACGANRQVAHGVDSKAQGQQRLGGLKPQAIVICRHICIPCCPRASYMVWAVTTPSGTASCQLPTFRAVSGRAADALSQSQASDPCTGICALVCAFGRLLIVREVSTLGFSMLISGGKLRIRNAVFWEQLSDFLKQKQRGWRSIRCVGPPA